MIANFWLFTLERGAKPIVEKIVTDGKCFRKTLPYWYFLTHQKIIVKRRPINNYFYKIDAMHTSIQCDIGP